MNIAASNQSNHLSIEHSISSTNKKILLIESNHQIANRFKTLLENSNHSCSGVAKDFLKAERIIQDNPPDAVFINVVLDGQFSGYQTAKIIKLDCDIPIYLLASKKSEELIKLVDEINPSGLFLLDNSDLSLTDQLNSIVD